MKVQLTYDEMKEAFDQYIQKRCPGMRMDYEVDVAWSYEGVAAEDAEDHENWVNSATVQVRPADEKVGVGQGG